jgi:hypothetical protein
MVHRCVRDDGHMLTIQVNFIVKCVCIYMGIRSNGGFMTGVTVFDWRVTIGCTSLVAWAIQGWTYSGYYCHER